MDILEKEINLDKCLSEVVNGLVVFNEFKFNSFYQDELKQSPSINATSKKRSRFSI